jgi:glycosyltransferase involved in cell wall biosynthesis
MKVSVFLPVYKTGAYLVELHQRLTKTLDTMGTEYELLFIDDGSPDDSWAIIRNLAAADPHVRAVRFSRNFGQHPAIAAALDHATGDVGVLMDTDLQDEPENIPLLVARLDDDTDIVYTVKDDPKADPMLTRLTSYIYHYAFSRISGTSVPRNIGTFRVLSARVLDALRSFPERNILYGPLTFFVGFQFAIVEVKRRARSNGTSAYSFRKRMKLAINSIITYTDLPHRFLMTLGTAIVVADSLYFAVLVLRYLTVGAQLPPGLTLVLAFITLLMGFVVLGVGITGSYAFRTYQETLGRPRYIVARELNLSGAPHREEAHHD